VIFLDTLVFLRTNTTMDMPITKLINHRNLTIDVVRKELPRLGYGESTIERSLPSY